MDRLAGNARASVWLMVAVCLLAIMVLGYSIGPVLDWVSTAVEKTFGARR